MTPRPLSPHLQIYRLPLAARLSIFHRFTGVIATLGLLCMVLWLLLLLGDGTAFSLYSALLGSWFGKLLLLLWSFALFYHLCNGIRHLVWDSGRGFEKQAYVRSGQAVIAVAAILTAILWLSF